MKKTGNRLNNFIWKLEFRPTNENTEKDEILSLINLNHKDSLYLAIDLFGFVELERLKYIEN